MVVCFGRGLPNVRVPVLITDHDLASEETARNCDVGMDEASRAEGL